MILHIDGDIVVYRAAFASEKVKYHLTAIDPYYDEDIDIVFDYKKDMDEFIKNDGVMEDIKIEKEIVLDTLENAKATVDSMIARMVNDVSAQSARVYLTGPTNFRNDVATLRKYKGNRDEARKPQHGPALRQYLIDEYSAIVSVDEEADDVIGYTHYGLYIQDKTSTCIATIDKDLDMIPGRHYNFVTGNAYTVEEDVALLNFWKQMITGDTTDNIPGLTKKGKKFADKLAFDCDYSVHVMGMEVKELYKAEFKEDWEKYYLEMGRLLWIRRYEGELWNER